MSSNLNNSVALSS